MNDFQEYNNICFIMSELSEDNRRMIEVFIHKTVKKYERELAKLTKKVEQLEQKRDILLVENNELQKNINRLQEVRIKFFKEKIEDLQHMTTRILNSQDPRASLKNITFFHIGSQTSMVSTWKNNQITDCEVNANCRSSREISPENTKNKSGRNDDSDIKDPTDASKSQNDIISERQNRPHIFTIFTLVILNSIMLKSTICDTKSLFCSIPDKIFTTNIISHDKFIRECIRELLFEQSLALKNLIRF